MCRRHPHHITFAHTHAHTHTHTHTHTHHWWWCRRCRGRSWQEFAPSLMIPPISIHCAVQYIVTSYVEYDVNKYVKLIDSTTIEYHLYNIHTLNIFVWWILDIEIDGFTVPVSQIHSSFHFQLHLFITLRIWKFIYSLLLWSYYFIHFLFECEESIYCN